MAERQAAATRKHKITRGPRKGQVVEVYVKSGTEVRRGDVATGKRATNRTKNSRAGQKYDESIDGQGREVHTYTDPKTGKQERVVLKGKRHDAVKNAKSVKSSDGKRNVLTTRQRENAVKRQGAAVKKRKAASKGPVQKRTKK